MRVRVRGCGLLALGADVPTLPSHYGLRLGLGVITTGRPDLALGADVPTDPLQASLRTLLPEAHLVRD